MGKDLPKGAPPPAFALLLKRLRHERELTQEELAERAGVSARLVSDLERSVVHRPRRDTIAMLADGLKLEGDERASFVAVARGFSVADSVSGASARTGSLPAPPTSILGREREVAHLSLIVREMKLRLLTLTGTGGVGKTRLAIELAYKVEELFRDGAIFIDVAPVQDSEFVPAS